MNEWRKRQQNEKIKMDLDIKNFDKIEKTLRRLQNLSNKMNNDVSKQSLKIEQDRLRQESKLAQKELEKRYKNELELAKRRTRDVTDIEKANIKEMSKMEQEIYKADKKQATDLAKHKQKLEQDLVKYRDGLSRLDTNKISQDNNSKLMSEYKDVANTIDKLQNQMNKGISGDSIVRTTNEVERLKRTYEQLARQIDEVNRKSFDGKRDNKNLVNMNRDLTKLESSAEKAMTKLNSLDFKHIDTSQIKEIESYLRRLKDVSSKDLNLDLDIHIGDAINQVKELDRALTNLSSVDKLVGDFQQIEHSIRDAFGDGVVNQLKNDLRQLEGMATNLDGSFDRAFNSMNAGMREVSGGINRMHSEVDQIGVSVGKFDRMFEFAIGDMAGDLLYDSLYSVVGAIGDLDTAITNVKKVADSSDINSAMKLDELKNNATDVARDVGMSISEVMEATASSIQAGVANSIQGSLQVAEQTMKLANVGEMTQNDASEAVNSMINGFKLNPLKQVQVEMDGTIRKTNELELAMDMLNFVGNNYAVSTSDITEALKRGGSVLSTYGVSLGDTIGMMTAANEIMQDPSKVGNAMKTIGMRLSGVTYKMKDGKTVLNDTGKALKDIAGIDVFEDEQQTQVKDMVTILDELDKKYDGLSEKDQLALGEKISGKNNAATFQSLMSNWDKFKQIQGEFSKGDHFGSMEKEKQHSPYVQKCA